MKKRKLSLRRKQACFTQPCCSSGWWQVFQKDQKRSNKVTASRLSTPAQSHSPITSSRKKICSPPPEGNKTRLGFSCSLDNFQQLQQEVGADERSATQRCVRVAQESSSCEVVPRKKWARKGRSKREWDHTGTTPSCWLLCWA